ncbi:NAD(P)-dependent oxidoreductase [Ectothiorhodospira variabilis]|uniref:NAD(P)-dependent oxidoreductase n=1 Tax=Ectothiorhodospira variabilis TaxID=505694 RepID=UPI001EFBBFD8|nr:NAD(P)-dependent oxidoreductase [Ectothiorhodospira variabilis]MCG5494012.1 siroheme synthase [Ectothiorhodospira variabilis]MCG5498055.1 siroheme synthase [Ectothiorhodospira variabilis]MCG5503458.1 siroheme synthase [Ectothiorhodospira variabilis]MCG5506454.1 siroheme synthase [Ectothiorhodospira variabilis]
MDHFPLFVDLRERPCLVVGGGRVAARKARRLQQAGARVHLLTPHLTPSLAEAVAQGLFEHQSGRFHPEALEGMTLVIAATDDETVNRAVYEAARQRGILVNVADRPALCSFIMPAVVDRSPLIVAIGTGGAAPVLARALRARLEVLLPRNLGNLAQLAGTWRDRVAQALPEPGQRRRFWEALLGGLWQPGMNRQPRHEDFSRVLDTWGTGSGAEGEVAFMPCPRDEPEHLTIQALRLLQQADVILHDPDTPGPVMDYARREAELIPAGHCNDLNGTPHSPTLPIMMRHVRDGARVVRIGRTDPRDPFASERATLGQLGIRAFPVPGVSGPVGSITQAMAS